MDIVALTETKKKGTGNELRGDYILFYSGVSKAKRAKAGVSIALHKKWRQNIKNCEEINERILRIDLEIWNHTLVIIGVYAPTDDANTVLKNEFEEELTNVLSNISSRKEVIVMGDLNARVGCRTNDQVVGRFGEKIVNDNGERLKEICQIHSLRIMNGFFQHPDCHKYTWTQPTRNLKSIIDYVILRQQSQLKTTDVRVYRGASGSDHFLVKAQTWIKYANQKGTATKVDNTQNIEEKRYNIDLLRYDSVKFLYKLRLANKLSYLTDDTVENMHASIKKSIHQAAFEALGEVEREGKRKQGLWWNDEVEELVKEKRRHYEKWLTTQNLEDRQQYTQINREVKRVINRTKNEAWENKCREIEQFIGGTRTKMAWKTISSLRKDNKNRINLPVIQMNEWVDYYKDMLTEDRQRFKNMETRTEVQGTIPEITKTEIEKSIKKMKNGKSPGPGGLPIELLKHAPDSLIDILQVIFNKCLIGGEEPPKEWKLAHLTSIHKKGSKKECKNYRGISVIATVGRLYGRILKERLEDNITIEEEQSGFTAGRSCVDNIFSIKQTIEKLKTRNREIHLIFIDLEKAYDTVPVGNLYRILESSSISSYYIAAIKNLYTDGKTQIKVGGKLSQPIQPTKGLRQGCCLSPTLFKIYINGILREWQNKCRKMGLDINGDFLHTLLFADDQILIAGDEWDIDYMMRKIVDVYDQAGLSVNYEKTRYLVINGESKNLLVNGQTIKVCDEYKYLGVTISNEGTSKKEINIRKIKAQQAVNKLNSVLWSKQITKQTKLRIYGAIVESIMLYGAETWEITKRERQRLEAVEMDYLRRSCGVSRLQRVTNTEIRRRMGVKKTVAEEIERRRLKWYGHVRRLEDQRWPRKIMEWSPPFRRKRGRPPEEWMKQVIKDIERRDLDMDLWRDREAWRRGCEKRPREL